MPTTRTADDRVNRLIDRSGMDIIWRSAKSLGRSIASGELTALAVVEAHLTRIGEVNGDLNAVVFLDADAALDQARSADRCRQEGRPLGPLHGVPITIKDTLDVADMPCTGGTLGRAGFVPKDDATAVSRLRAAGAIILGKTNVPELAGALETDNLIHGRTSNPYDISRTPGGSSGGDAAIVAAGGVPCSLGTDAGGSIRIPAHFCGLAALKPSTGRVPRTGQFPPPLGARNALSHVSAIARHVEDLPLMLDVISGADRLDHAAQDWPIRDASALSIAGLRVAWFDDDGAQAPTEAIKAAVRSSAVALADAGAIVEAARPDDVEQAAPLWNDITRGDGGAGLRNFLASIGTDRLSPLLEQSLKHLMGPAMPSITAALGAFAQWDVFRNRLIAFMADRDVLLCPVAPYAALPHGRSFDASSLRGLGYSQLHNLTGWPAVTVPVASSAEGLPIGVQIAASPWREDIAIAVAAFLETRFAGWRSNGTAAPAGR